MNSSIPRGFTLVEVLVGISILALLLGGFTFFLRSSTKEVGFTAEHFTAMLLAQKVREDISQELETNPWGLRSLGIEQSAGEPEPIVDGGSIYFSYLEDRFPPWKFIDPLDDGKVDSEMMPLYDQVKDFRIGVSASRVPEDDADLESRRLAKVTIQVTWKAKTGTGKYTLETFFPIPDLDKGVSSPFVVDRGKVERELARAFFRSSDASFQRLLSLHGGDERTILAWGKIHYACRSFFASPFVRTILPRIRRLETRRKILVAAGSDEAYGCTLELGRYFYEIAKFSFNVVSFLEEDLETVRTGFDRAHLGSYLWKRRRILASDARNFESIVRDFTTGIAWARTRYEELLEPGLARMRGKRRQFQNLQRVNDLYKLAAACESELPGSGRDAAMFLKRVQDFSQGRNPFLNRFATQELALVVNPPELLGKYPLLRRVSDLFSIRIPQARAFFRQAFPPRKRTPTAKK